MRYVLSALLASSFLASGAFALPIKELKSSQSVKLITLCPEGADILHAWITTVDGIHPHHRRELYRAALEWGAERGVVTVPFEINETDAGFGMTLICAPFFF